MDAAARNRMKLWLRSERAFGLSAVPWKSSISAAGEVEQATTNPKKQSAPIAPARDAARRTAGDAATPVAGAKAPVTSRAATAATAPTAAKPAVEQTAPAVTAPPGGLLPLPSIEPFTAPLLPTADKAARLIALENNEVRGCTRCRLCETRTNTVFGEGSVDAKIFFIGEGPGENEDLQSRPFVGRAGEMLNKWIAAMGLRREDVYIANIVKCRPPGNRVPMPDEVATCTPYLERQLELIRPRVIVTLGLPSLKYMMNDPKLAMGKSRGIWRDWRGIKLMPTFHPAYVLRSYNEETRGAVWSDLKMVLTELGMKIPTSKKES